MKEEEEEKKSIWNETDFIFVRLSIWFASLGGASAVVTFCKCDAGTVSVLFAFSVGNVRMLYNLFC